VWAQLLMGVQTVVMEMDSETVIVPSAAWWYVEMRLVVVTHS
jgi:hypothetical protein